MITTIWSLIFSLVINSATINKQSASKLPPAPVVNSVQQESPATQPVISSLKTISSTDQLAKCLTTKGAKMYGADWCPHCSDQKKDFGTSFRFIKYIECDPKGPNADPSTCQKAAIEAYPTWILPGTKNLTGTQQLADLASWSKCQN